MPRTVGWCTIQPWPSLGLEKARSKWTQVQDKLTQATGLRLMLNDEG